MKKKYLCIEYMPPSDPSRSPRTRQSPGCTCGCDRPYKVVGEFKHWHQAKHCADRYNKAIRLLEDVHES